MFFAKETKFLTFLILFSIVFIYSYTGFSQESFLPGYVIALNGDTLAGEILDQDDYLNAQILIFRENENAIEQIFSPTDISAYFISNNKFYQSKIFNHYQEIPVKELLLIINTSNESIDKSAFEIKTDTAFIRVIVKGEAQLYTHSDINGKTLYFVETPSGGFKHLIHHKTYYTRNNKTIKFKARTTIQDSLELLVADCTEELLIEKRRRIILSDVINLVMDYNTCINSESKIIQPKSKTKINFGLNIGINYSNVYTRADQAYIIDKYDFSAKQGIMAGVLIDWYLNSIKQKWVIQTEFSLNQKGAVTKGEYYQYDFNIPDKPIDTFKVKLDFTYIDFSLSLKYFMTAKNCKLRPYLGMGILFGYQANNEKPVVFYKKDGEVWDFYGSSSFTENEYGIEGKLGILYQMHEHIGVFVEFKSSYTELINKTKLERFTNTLYGFSFGLYL